jgi:hypothetical protein
MPLPDMVLLGCVGGLIPDAIRCTTARKPHDPFETRVSIREQSNRFPREHPLAGGLLERACGAEEKTLP